MNEKKLLKLEQEVLSKYPDGFDAPEMKKIGKKHNLSKLVDYIHEHCSEENLSNGISVYNDVVKIVSKSSMVSVFEKMRFRDFARELDKTEKAEFLETISELLHGNQKLGFNNLIRLLTPYKLAKWPLITVWRAYYYPSKDVFVKPTTVKKIISHLDIKDIKYTPQVNYAFYRKYKSYLTSMKKVVKTKSLKPNNPAFSGFLMMTIK